MDSFKDDSHNGIIRHESTNRRRVPAHPRELRWRLFIPPPEEIRKTGSPPLLHSSYSFERFPEEEQSYKPVVKNPAIRLHPRPGFSQINTIIRSDLEMKKKVIPENNHTQD
jgi:hypothetical protein